MFTFTQRLAWLIWPVFLLLVSCKDYSENTDETDPKTVQDTVVPAPKFSLAPLISVNYDSILAPIRQALADCDFQLALRLKEEMPPIEISARDAAEKLIQETYAERVNSLSDRKKELLLWEDDITGERYYTSPLQRKLKGKSSVQLTVREVKGKYELYYVVIYSGQAVSGQFSKYYFKTDNQLYEYSAAWDIFWDRLKNINGPTTAGSKPVYRQITTKADYRMLYDLAHSESVKMRYQGNDSFEDRNITKTEQAAMKEVLCFFDLLGVRFTF